MINPMVYGHYKHKKSGKEYILVGFANLSSTNPKFVATVIYQCLENNDIWARPLDEFKVKFTEVKKEKEK